MGLMQQIKVDVERITGATNEFAQPVSIKSPSGEIADTTGLYADISIMLDSNGNPYTTRDVNASISEGNILAANPNYPTRNSRGTLDFKGHLVTLTYADTSTIQMKVKDFFPDATINLVNLILENYAAS